MNASHNKIPIIEIGEANFEPEVLRWKQPVLVAFSAAWSLPCRILNSHNLANCSRDLVVLNSGKEPNNL